MEIAAGCYNVSFGVYFKKDDYYTTTITCFFFLFYTHVALSRSTVRILEIALGVRSKETLEMQITFG